MSTFRDDTLHLTYSYPSNYADASAMVGPAFQASMNTDPAAAGQARCISLPFSRAQPAKGQIGILLLVRADAACLKKKFNAHSVEELAAGEAQGLAAAGAKTSFGQPIAFEIAGRPASSLEGSFVLPTGVSLQARVVCVLDRPDIACWQFLASTPEMLRTMGHFPVTFDGSPAVSLEQSTPTH